MVGIRNLKDENLLRLYDSVRTQVAADRRSKYKFAGGPSVKQYAEALSGEITRRGLQHTPIEWDG